MEFDVLELYKIYAENPDNFIKVLRNIYGYEIEHLFDKTMETAEDISREDDVNHWKSLSDKLEELELEFVEPLVFLKFFRKVNMNEFMNANELICHFKFYSKTIEFIRQDGWDSVESVREKMKAEQLSKKDAEEKFRELREELFRRLEEIMLSLLDIDEKI